MGTTAKNRRYSKSATNDTAIGPFIKLIKDMERISEAVQNDQPLSSLKDIKFVCPVRF